MTKHDDAKYAAVVFVPQIGGGEDKPVWFTNLQIARMYAQETGGTLYVRENT